MFIFCLIKKGYVNFIDNLKFTRIVLSIQIFVSLFITIKFGLDVRTILLNLSLPFLSHIVIVDKKDYLIPYLSIISLFILGIVSLFINEFPYDFVSRNSRIFSFIMFVLLWQLLVFIQKRINKEFLGGGDLMLFCVISLLFGLFITILGIFIASFVALVVESLRKNKHKQLPFGPYLILGFIISILTIDNIIKILY